MGNDDSLCSRESAAATLRVRNGPHAQTANSDSRPSIILHIIIVAIIRGSQLHSNVEKRKKRFSMVRKCRDVTGPFFQPMGTAN
jgi:hypothetical protein